MPGTRTMVLRNITHLHQTFIRSGNNIDYETHKVELDNPGDWIPPQGELTALQRCRFDNCDSKKLVSIHVYMKDLYLTPFVGALTPSSGAVTQADTRFHTWHDQYRESSLANLNSHFLQSQGIPGTTRRGIKRYHKVFRTSVYSRAATTDTLNELNTTSWANITRELDLFNKTGGGATNTRLNIDFHWAPEAQMAPPTLDSGCLAKFGIVVATKWRLFGAEV